MARCLKSPPRHRPLGPVAVPRVGRRSVQFPGRVARKGWVDGLFGASDSQGAKENGVADRGVEGRSLLTGREGDGFLERGFPLSRGGGGTVELLAARVAGCDRFVQSDLPVLGGSVRPLKLASPALLLCPQDPVPLTLPFGILRAPEIGRSQPFQWFLLSRAWLPADVHGSRLLERAMAVG